MLILVNCIKSYLNLMYYYRCVQDIMPLRFIIIYGFIILNREDGVVKSIISPVTNFLTIIIVLGVPHCLILIERTFFKNILHIMIIDTRLYFTPCIFNNIYFDSIKNK